MSSSHGAGFLVSHGHGAATEIDSAQARSKNAVARTHTDWSCYRGVIIPVEASAAEAPAQALTAADGAEARPAPREFVPLTVHVYLLPAVRRVTVSGVRVPVFERATPPLLDVHEAVYPVIARPLLAPDRNDTRSEPAATLVVATRVGAAGDPMITAAEALDHDPPPRPFVALTLHVYRFPVVARVTVKGERVPVEERAIPPLLDVHEAV